jgi:hypothetical protein
MIVIANNGNRWAFSPKLALSSKLTQEASPRQNIPPMPSAGIDV